MVILTMSIIGNALTFYFFDRSVQDVTLWDGFWYSLVSITTVGYGDLYAISTGARIGTSIFIIVIGLAAFTTSIGMLIGWIVDIRQKERTGMGKARTRNHLLIVNFPNESRVRQIIQEFTRDVQHQDRDIVLVADDLESLPFEFINVSFIKGSVLEQETYQRANVSRADQAIVLSPSYDDPRSDSLVASIAFVIEHIHPGITIIAECLDPKHTVLFDVSKNVSLVYTTQVANNLLVQEAQDPGVNMLTQAITSNLTEIPETLASTTLINPPTDPNSYINVAKQLLDHGINLVGVVREGTLRVSLEDLTLSQGDSLVYISKTRYSSKSLESLLL